MPVCKPQSFGSGRPTTGVEGPSLRRARTTEECLRTIAVGPKVWSHSAQILLLVPPVLSVLCALSPPCLAAQSKKVAYTNRTAATDFLSYTGMRYDGTQEDADFTFEGFHLREVPWYTGTLLHNAGTKEKAHRRRTCSVTVHGDPKGQTNLVESTRRLTEQMVTPSGISTRLEHGDRSHQAGERGERGAGKGDLTVGPRKRLLLARFSKDKSQGNAVQQRGFEPSGFPLDAMNVLQATVTRSGLPHDPPYQAEDRHARRRTRGHRKRVRPAISVKSVRGGGEEVRSTAGWKHTATLSHDPFKSPADENRRAATSGAETPHLSRTTPERKNQHENRLAVIWYPLQAGGLNTVQETAKPVSAKGAHVATTAIRGAEETRAHGESAARSAQDSAVFERAKRKFLDRLQDEERLHSHVDHVLKKGAKQERLQMSLPSTRNGQGRKRHRGELARLVDVENKVHQHQQEFLAEQLVGELRQVIEKAGERAHIGTSVPETAGTVDALSTTRGLWVPWNSDLLDSQHSPSRNKVSEQNGCQVSRELAQKQRRASGKASPSPNFAKHTLATNSTAVKSLLRNKGGTLQIAAASAVNEERRRELHRLLQLMRSLGHTQTQVGSERQIKPGCCAEDKTAASAPMKEELHRICQESGTRLTGAERTENFQQALGGTKEIHGSDKLPHQDTAEQKTRNLPHGLIQHQKGTKKTRLLGTSEMSITGTSKGWKAELPKTYKELQVVGEAQKMEDSDKSGTDEEIQQKLQERLQPTMKQQIDQLEKEVTSLRALKELAAGAVTETEQLRLKQQQLPNEHLSRTMQTREELGALPEKVKAEEDDGSQRRAEAKQALRTQLEAALDQQGRLLQGEREAMTDTQMCGLNTEVKKDPKQLQRQQQERLQEVQELKRDLQALRQAQGDDQTGRCRGDTEVEKSVQDPLGAALDQLRAQLEKAVESLRVREALAARTGREPEVRRLQQQQNEPQTRGKSIGANHRALGDILEAGEDERSRRQAEPKQTLRTQREAAPDQQGRLPQAELEAEMERQMSGLNTEAKKELQQQQRQQQEHPQRVQELRKGLQAVPYAQEEEEEEERERTRRETEIGDSVQERLHAGLVQQKAPLEKEVKHIREQEASVAGTDAETEVRQLAQRQKEHLTEVMQVREDLRELREKLNAEENEGSRRRAEVMQALRAQLEAALGQQGRLRKAERRALMDTQIPALNTEAKKELQQLQRRRQEHQQLVQGLQGELPAVRQAQENDEREKSGGGDTETEETAQERVDAELERQVAQLKNDVENTRAQEVLAAGTETETELRRLLQQQKEHLSKLMQMREDLRALRGLQASTESDGTRLLEGAVRRLEEHLRAALQQQKSQFQTQIDSLEAQWLERKKNPLLQQQKEHVDHTEMIKEEPLALRAEHKASGRGSTSLPPDGERRPPEQLDEAMDWHVKENHANKSASKTTPAPPAGTTKAFSDFMLHQIKLPGRQLQKLQPRVWAQKIADTLWGARLPSGREYKPDTLWGARLPSGREYEPQHPVPPEERFHTSESSHLGAVTANGSPAAWLNVNDATQKNAFNHRLQHFHKTQYPRITGKTMYHTLLATNPFTPSEEPEEEQYARTRYPSVKGLPRSPAKKKPQGLRRLLKRGAAAAGAAAGVGALLYMYNRSSYARKPAPSLTEAYKKNLGFAKSAGLEGSAILR